MPWRWTHPVPLLYSAMHGVGSVLAMTGGLIAAAVADAPATASATGYAGIVMALCGLITAIAPFYFRDRSEQRAERAKATDSRVADLAARQDAALRETAEYRAKMAAVEVEKAKLQAKVEELEKTRVGANATAIANQAGRLDAAYMTLVDKGIIAPAPEDGHGPGAIGPRLLVVEDDPRIVRSWSFILTRWGFNVSDANAVDAAIIKLEQDRPEWVLLDLGLAGGDDGLAVLEYVRDSGLPSRVIVMTGSADAEQLAKVRALRPDGLFIKPIEPEKVAALRALIRPDPAGADAPTLALAPPEAKP